MAATQEFANHAPNAHHTPTQMARRAWLLLPALLALAAIALLLGVCVGSTGWEQWQELLSGSYATNNAEHSDAADMLRRIVWEIRLPRALGAWLAGALLGMAGAVAQGLFRNPLADPYLLGSSSGASLGVALVSMALLDTPFLLLLHVGVTGAAFVGACLAVLLTLFLARGTQSSLRLLLAGVVVGVVLGAVTSLILLTRMEIWQAMQSFLLGSTSLVGWPACLVMAAAAVLCAAAAYLLAPALDGLALGEWTAQTLGLALPKMRMGLVAVLALCTGAAVAQVGLVAFVGLVAPHLVRGMVQPKHGLLVLLSAAMGGLLFLLADILARSLIAPQELPVGTLTAVLGGGYLLWLMYRGKVRF